MRQKFTGLVLVSILLPAILSVLGHLVIGRFLDDAGKSYMAIKAGEYRSTFMQAREAFMHRSFEVLYHRTNKEDKDVELIEEARDNLSEAALGLIGEYLSSSDSEIQGKARDFENAWANSEKTVEGIVQEFSEGKKSFKEISESLDGLEDQFVGLEAIIEQVDKKFREQAASANSFAYKARTIMLYFIILNTIFLLFYAALAIGLVMRATQRIQEVSARMNANVDRLVNASTVLSSGGQQLSAATNEQAAAVHESVASATEIQSMVEKTGAKAEDFLAVAEKVNSYVDSGMGVLVNLVDSMKEIKEMTGNLAQISGIIENIAEKTKVINDIVFKTQLLSFNASIEAARAGQHGRGFSVVAEEVGNLAQLSGGAANAIDHLIRDSRNQVQRFLSQAGERVERGELVTREIEKVYQNIASELEDMKSGLNVVRQANSEQMGGLEQVSKAMQQISAATQQSEHAVRGLLGLSIELTGESQNVHEISIDLRRIVDGESRSSFGAPVTTRPGNVISLAQAASARREVASPAFRGGGGSPKKGGDTLRPSTLTQSVGSADVRGYIHDHLDEISDEMFRKTK